MRKVASAFSPALTSNPRPDPTSPAYITHSPSSSPNRLLESRFPAPSLIPPSAFALALQLLSTSVPFQSQSNPNTLSSIKDVRKRKVGITEKELGKRQTYNTTPHASHQNGYPRPTPIGHSACPACEYYEFARELLLQVLLVSCDELAAVELCGC